MAPNTSSITLPSPLGLTKPSSFPGHCPSYHKANRLIKTRCNRRFTRKKGSLLVRVITRNALSRLRAAVPYKSMAGGAQERVKEQMRVGKAVAELHQALGCPAASSSELDLPKGPVVEQDARVPIADRQPSPYTHTVQVQSRQRNDWGVVYEMRDDETFEEIYEDYSSRVDLKPHEIVLKKNDIVISPTYVAENLRIRSGDVLDAIAVHPGTNMNTKIKHFIMRNTCTPYHEVQVCARLTTKLKRVCQKWGQQVNKDPRSIVLMHETEQASQRWGCRNQEQGFCNCVSRVLSCRWTWSTVPFGFKYK